MDEDLKYKKPNFWLSSDMLTAWVVRNLNFMIKCLVIYIYILTCWLVALMCLKHNKNYKWKISWYTSFKVYLYILHLFSTCSLRLHTPPGLPSDLYRLQYYSCANCSIMTGYLHEQMFPWLQYYSCANCFHHDRIFACAHVSLAAIVVQIVSIMTGYLHVQMFPGCNSCANCFHHDRIFACANVPWLQ